MTTEYEIEFDYIKLGTSGDDTINGDTGNGFINGLNGDDNIIGFAGDDVILGDDIPLADYIDVNTDGFQAALSTLYQSIQDRDVTWLSLSDIENMLFEVQNVLVDNPGFLTELLTQGGDDTLIGGAGNDILYGGAGSDILRGGSGDDLLIGLAGNNALLGGEGSDVVIGGIGNDRLFGNDGDDYLVGTTGNDFYFGGSGSDYFIFTRLFDSQENTDRIVDFELGIDTVVLLNVADNFQQLTFNQTGPTVELQLADNQTLIFNNTNVNDLSANDFIFYNV